MAKLNFHNTITERDMDLLFAEAAYSDPEFCEILLKKTDLAGKPFQVLGAEISKSDSDLGESDITVLIDVEGRKYGFLVEDKIDAIAMPEQHARYVKRGEKGIKNKEYDDFRVFLFCPQKYAGKNKEAKLYEHLLTYEECLKYFADKKDPLSAFRRQQLEQAISKAKSPYNPTVDKSANAFLRQYIAYQKEHFASLDLSTREDKNGWWTDFRTTLGTAYITHKIREGFVDLTIPGAQDKYDLAKVVADWARQHIASDIAVVKAKKSAMIRIHVPKLNIENGFENVNQVELNKCFNAVKELSDFANMIEIAHSLAEK